MIRRRAASKSRCGNLNRFANTGTVFHGCHRELVKFQPEVSFELLNFMELIGEAMGIHIPDLYKRLSLMGDIDAIVADTADLIAVHGLDLDMVRDVLAEDIYGGGASVPGRSAVSPVR